MQRGQMGMNVCDGGPSGSSSAQRVHRARTGAKRLRQGSHRLRWLQLRHTSHCRLKAKVSAHAARLNPRGQVKPGWRCRNMNSIY